MINLNQAKAKLGQYVRRVCQGERVILCERNRPVAELRPVLAASRRAPLNIGVLTGAFEVPADFDAPLEAFEAAFYGGEPDSAR